jgi:hypothetical protein
LPGKAREVDESGKAPIRAAIRRGSLSEVEPITAVAMPGEERDL